MSAAAPAYVREASQALGYRILSAAGHAVDVRGAAPAAATADRRARRHQSPHPAPPARHLPAAAADDGSLCGGARRGRPAGRCARGRDRFGRAHRWSRCNRGAGAGRAADGSARGAQTTRPVVAGASRRGRRRGTRRPNLAGRAVGAGGRRARPVLRARRRLAAGDASRQPAPRGLRVRGVAAPALRVADDRGAGSVAAVDAAASRSATTSAADAQVAARLRRRSRRDAEAPRPQALRAPSAMVRTSACLPTRSGRGWLLSCAARRRPLRSPGVLRAGGADAPARPCAGQRRLQHDVVGRRPRPARPAERLSRAFAAVVERHWVLRSTFHWRDGDPRQTVQPLGGSDIDAWT